MKWTNKGGLYEFEIKEVDGLFDLDVFYLKQREGFWFHSLNAAKSFVRKNYAGIKLDGNGRWKKVEQ